MSITARDYQVRAIDGARRAIRSGKRAPLIVAPTGAGKTTIASLIVSGHLSKAVVGGKAPRVVWLAHRRELVKQAAATLTRAGLVVGHEGLNANAPVQVTSIQTVLARGELPEATLAVIDEAHHIVSTEWIKIPRAYLAHGTLLVGLSATPERADGLGLGGKAGVFDHLEVAAQIGELIAAGHLVPCDVLAPRAGFRSLALDPWDAYQRYTPRGRAVVFAPHVKAAEEFAEDFRARGIEAAVVHGELEDVKRDRACEAFARGELPVLVNVMVLTEGWDAPIADTCILARRVGSPSLFLQMVGRVLRTRPGKTGATLLDLAGNVMLHGRPDEERIYSLEGPAVKLARGSAWDGVRLCKRCKAEIPPEAMACEECGKPVASLRTPKGEGVELDRHAWFQRLPEDKRVGKLAKFYREGLAKGYARGWAENKFKWCSGHYPPADVKVAAWKLAEAQRARELEEQAANRELELAGDAAI